jgi:hypothetical protein
MYKIEVQEPNGMWHDVCGDDGRVLTFESETTARDKLQELFPVLVKMEDYASPKRTRVVRIWSEQEDEDWSH